MAGPSSTAAAPAGRRRAGEPHALAPGPLTCARRHRCGTPRAGAALGALGRHPASDLDGIARPSGGISARAPRHLRGGLAGRPRASLPHRHAHSAPAALHHPGRREVTAWTLDPIGKVTRDRGCSRRYPAGRAGETTSPPFIRGVRRPPWCCLGSSLEIAAGQWLRRTAPGFSGVHHGRRGGGGAGWPNGAGEELASGSAGWWPAGGAARADRDLAYCTMVAYRAQANGRRGLDRSGGSRPPSRRTRAEPALPEFVCRTLAGWKDQL
jgi:hypothetical protein